MDCAAVPTTCPIFSVTSAGGLTAQDDVYGFLQRTQAGDGFMVARLRDLTGVPTSLAGLSIRGALTTGAAQVSVFRTPAGTTIIRSRASAGAAVSQTTAAYAPASATWLKLERKASVVSVSVSVDGTQWTQLADVTVALPTYAYFGLAVTSQRPDAVTTATMSDVRLEAASTLPSGWTKVELGTASSLAQFAQGTWTLNQKAPVYGAENPVLVYQRVSGNADIRIRVRSVTGATSSVAGLMVRSTLDTASPFWWIRVSSAGQRTVNRRPAAGMAANTAVLSPGPVATWLRLVRQGIVTTAYQSADGQTWTMLMSDTVNLSPAVYLGIALATGPNTSASAVFDSMTLLATSANQPPRITLTSPAGGQSIVEGSLVSIAASASDADDRVEAVEFFVDGSRVGVDTAAPYAASWAAAGVGTHRVTASVRDSDGAVVPAYAVSFSVLARPVYGGSGSPAPPPPSGASLPPPGTFRLMFAPSLDHDRTVDRYAAEIYADNGLTLVGARDLGRPAVVNGDCTVDLSAFISALPSGSYRIVVRAVDDSNGTRSIGAGFDFRR